MFLKKKFRPLEITAKKLVDSFGTGIHLSNLKDSLIEVDGTRSYQPGDKRLDSKSSLKSGELMSRVFNPEKDFTIFIILDISASQHYGSDKLLKIEGGILSALYLNYLASNSGDNVAVLTFDEEVRSLNGPTKDYGEIVNSLKNILNKTPNKGSNLNLALMNAFKLNLKNTLFFVISDFCYKLDKRAIQLMRVLSMGNNVLLSLMLVDGGEVGLKFPFSGNVVDAEGDQSCQWNFKDDMLDAHQSWEKDIVEKLSSKAKCTSVILDVDSNNFIMPLTKYFLKGS